MDGIGGPRIRKRKRKQFVSSSLNPRVTPCCLNSLLGATPRTACSFLRKTSAIWRARFTASLRSVIGMPPREGSRAYFPSAIERLGIGYHESIKTVRKPGSGELLICGWPAIRRKKLHLHLE